MYKTELDLNHIECIGLYTEYRIHANPVILGLSTEIMHVVHIW